MAKESGAIIVPTMPAFYHTEMVSASPEGRESSDHVKGAVSDIRDPEHAQHKTQPRRDYKENHGPAQANKKLTPESRDIKHFPSYR